MAPIKPGSKAAYSIALRVLPFCALLLAFASAPAHAGFEFKAPPVTRQAPQQQQDGPRVPAFPAGAVDATPVSPPAPARPVPPVDPWPLVPGAVEQQAMMPIATPPAQQPATLFPAGDYPVAEGFGSDIPLALVMRQIVPETYAYSFDPEVDQAAAISWQGGQPWYIVLQEALNKAGLEAALVDQTIWIRPLGTSIEQAATTTSNNETASLPLMKGSAPAGYLPGPIALNKPQPDPRAYMPPMQTPQNLVPHDVMPIQAPAPIAAPPQPQAQTPKIALWQAAKGSSLHDILMVWSGQAGVKLLWEAEYDYFLPKTVRVRGEFSDAVALLLAAYESEFNRPMGIIHAAAGSTSENVLVIRNETILTQ